MKRSLLRRVWIAVSALALSAAAHAQIESGGLDLIYQQSGSYKAGGGTVVHADDDLGLSIAGSYRFNPHLEAQLALDWIRVDYSANIATNGGSFVAARGSYSAFDPHVNLVFYFLDKPITPYVLGGIGYSFVDTEIPAGRPQTGCWWDPWYGYTCATVQSTKVIDGFAYQLGAGLRWSVTSNVDVKLGYEVHWVDFGGSIHTESVDQVRLGVSYHY